MAPGHGKGFSREDRETVKAFNKKGDSGETSLLYGGRVAKSDPRCEAYGTLDEVNSILGVAKCQCNERIKGLIHDLQQELFIVGAELATTQEHYQTLVEKHSVVTSEMVDRLESLIEEIEAKIDMPRAFVVPGNCLSGSLLDVARAVLRRGERRAVSLAQENGIPNKEVLRYLNRMADLLFTLARYEERMA